VLSQIIQDVEMSSIHQMQMSQNLTAFHDILGGCERLLRAPIPVSYTRCGGRTAGSEG
jgi:predicted membrane chloride channel (bestrophin family)